MATPINTPLTGEIWHLSIDDLLAPLPAKPRLGGPGPFVINLSASTAPIAQPVKGMLECPHAHVYQIQRTEDRRMRYRLRLGPFSSEDEADAILQKVRDLYPSALTATAEPDDLRAIASLRSKTDAQPAPKPVDTAPPVPASPPIPVLTAVAAPRELHPAIAVHPTVPKAAPCPPPARREPSVSPVRLTPAAITPAPITPTPITPTPIAPMKSHAPGPVEQLSTRIADLETTQTIRALTSLELEDSGALRWFVIQLSLSEEGFDPDSLPNLDIFSVYRLYAVAGIDQGRIVHALRLGFFSEEIAASAVASYLSAYYDKPTVKRVSVAERERFADQRVEARKDIGATGVHAVIEITGERVIRENRGVAAVGLPGAAKAIFTQQPAVHKRR